MPLTFAIKGGIMNKIFLNDVEKIESPEPGYYGFREAPKLLCVHSRIFQALISQAGSRLLSGEFHNLECEGGCLIKGVGGLKQLQ